MIWRLLLLFTVVPALELYVLLRLGALFGPAATFLLILLTGVAGAWLAKREGIGVLMDLRRELDRGLPGSDRLMEGVMVLVGGILLVTPGLITDLVGLLLIVPQTRRWLAPRLLAWLASHVDVSVVGELGPGDLGGAATDPRARVRDPLHPPRTVERRPAPEGNPFASKFDDLP